MLLLLRYLFFIYYIKSICKNICFGKKAIECSFLCGSPRPRTLGLTSDIAHILQGLNPQPRGPVFRVTEQQLKYQLNKASTKSGLGHIRPHDMRHSFAVNFLNRGGRIEQLQRLLGHSKITTTQRYLRFKTGEIASKMMVMDGMIPLDIVSGNK